MLAIMLTHKTQHTDTHTLTRSYAYLLHEQSQRIVLGVHGVPIEQPPGYDTAGLDGPGDIRELHKYLTHPAAYICYRFIHAEYNNTHS